MTIRPDLIPHLRVDWQKFASDLRRHRESKGLTVRDVQKQTGVAIAVVSRAEHGETVTVTAFLRLLAWTGWGVERYIDWGSAKLE